LSFGFDIYLKTDDDGDKKATHSFAFFNTKYELCEF